MDALRGIYWRSQTTDERTYLGLHELQPNIAQLLGAQRLLIRQETIRKDYSISSLRIASAGAAAAVRSHM
jgi:hypothetical protein